MNDNQYIIQGFIDILYSLRKDGSLGFMPAWVFYELIDVLQVLKVKLGDNYHD